MPPRLEPAPFNEPKCVTASISGGRPIFQVESGVVLLAVMIKLILLGFAEYEKSVDCMPIFRTAFAGGLHEAPATLYMMKHQVDRNPEQLMMMATMMMTRTRMMMMMPLMLMLLQ